MTEIVWRSHARFKMLGSPIQQGQSRQERGSHLKATKNRRRKHFKKSPLHFRSAEEYATAIAYLELIEEQAERYADPQLGKLVGKVAAKGRLMLLWAIGEENSFGDLIKKGTAQRTTQTAPHGEPKQKEES